MTRREFCQATGAAGLGAARGRPNILFLFPDQHRFDWTGANRGLDLRTPNLDSLNRRGTRFTRAITPSPLCAPARAAVAAGLDYERCRVPNNQSDYPLDQPTVYRLLRDAGYHVMGCGKFDLHKATDDWGLDGKRLLDEWGFSEGIDNAGKRDAIRSGAVTPKDPYMKYLHERGLAAAHVGDFKARRGASATFPTPLPEEAYCDNWVGSHGLRLLREAPPGKPWFLQVNFTGPHEPMDITARMEKTVRGRKFPQPFGDRKFPPATHVTIRQNYAAMIENIDRWTGLYLDEVKKRGQIEETLIVYSSDHGEMLGDHGRWGKSVPYQPSIGVPLTVAGPRVKAGAVTDALAGTLDLTATFLDWAGLDIPSGMDSRSLRPVLEGRRGTHREVLRSGLNEWRIAWDGRYKLVRGFGEASMQLFDLSADPDESRDVAASHPEVVKRLRQLL